MVFYFLRCCFLFFSSSLYVYMTLCNCLKTYKLIFIKYLCGAMITKDSILNGFYSELHWKVNKFLNNIIWMKSEVNRGKLILELTENISYKFLAFLICVIWFCYYIHFPLCLQKYFKIVLYRKNTIFFLYLYFCYLGVDYT